MKRKRKQRKQKKAAEGRTSQRASSKPQSAPQSAAAPANPMASAAGAVPSAPDGAVPDQSSVHLDPRALGEYPTKPLWHFDDTSELFLPIKAPAGWNATSDVKEFIAGWGRSDDHRRRVELLLKEGVDQTHAALNAGIEYFSKDRKALSLMPPSVLNLQEKVQLFTELLPSWPDKRQTNQFTLALAWILWLESERGRIMAHPVNHQWQFPFYRLADSFLAAAMELREALQWVRDEDSDELAVSEEQHAQR